MGNSASTEYLLPCSEALWSASTPPPELRALVDTLRAASKAPPPSATCSLLLYVSVPTRSPTPQPGLEASAGGGSGSPSWADAAVLGHASLELRGCEGFVSDLTLLPEHRGKGHSARLLASVRALAASHGAAHLWPRSPSEDALEWCRRAALAASAAHLAAWLLLHGGADFALPPELLPAAPAQPAEHAQALAALAAPGALPALARRQQWSITALIKAWGMFLAGECAFQEEHALAVALLMGVEVFGEDAGLAGEEEGEGEAGEEGEGEEGEGEGEGEGAGVGEGEEEDGGMGASAAGGADTGTGTGTASSAAQAPAVPVPASPRPDAAFAATNRRGKRPRGEGAAGTPASAQDDGGSSEKRQK